MTAIRYHHFGPTRLFPFVLSLNIAPKGDRLWYHVDKRGYILYSLVSLYFVKLDHGHAVSLYIGPVVMNFAWGTK